jgi:hypothetical protein
MLYPMPRFSREGIVGGDLAVLGNAVKFQAATAQFVVDIIARVGHSEPTRAYWYHVVWTILGHLTTRHARSPINNIAVLATITTHP